MQRKASEKHAPAVAPAPAPASAPVPTLSQPTQPEVKQAPARTQEDDVNESISVDPIAEQPHEKEATQQPAPPAAISATAAHKPKKSISVHVHTERRHALPLRRRAIKYQKADVCKLTTAASRRITLRGGCKTRDPKTRDILSLIANRYLEAIAANAIAYTQHANRKTVSPGDVIHALARYNLKCYGFKEM